METIKIVKVGGNVIDNEAALEKFLSQFASLEGLKVLVHGGGKLATKLAQDMQVPVNMVDGRRITDSATLDIISMVYAGKINKNIIAKLQAYNCNAIGFSGADGNTIVSVKRPVKKIDYGYVGDVKKVNTKAMQVLIDNDITPVFCAISHDQNGQLLNTNADTIASEVAIALSRHYKTELIYCFEKNGVLLDVDDDNSVIDYMDSGTYETLKIQGKFAGGMLPKLENCYYALQEGVSRVIIGNPSVITNRDQKFSTLYI
ncbi:acetylglutamate kinase [Neotamlana laminarinivorans]|uniref:Acetylglutamate kinase n=1 Tax=Neotamlana laminarinivorans TaxID=2883124 RepID=A0A9X1HYR3_9FLAO|nr:acetylglutamate kinase [Tamlana laminarinivorans]MCB4798593.1 acetylglutamate kinase [Tamlana laminarinivorans]